MSVLNSFVGYIFPRLHVKMFVCEASYKRKYDVIVAEQAVCR